MRNGLKASDEFFQRNAFRRLRIEKEESGLDVYNKSDVNVLKGNIARYIRAKSNFLENEEFYE